MDEKKFGNILTVVLIVLIVIIIGIIAYFGYSTYSKNKVQSNSDIALQEFKQKISEKEKETGEEVQDTTLAEISGGEYMENPTGSKKQGEKTYMEGFEVLGTIKIKKIKLEYPILSRVTTRSLEIAVAKFYGVELNEVGNVTIMGHNYRNGLFFSNNKNLKNGDEIEITDSTGTTITYVIYDMFYTTPDDANYMKRDTNGKREISLSTCNDDSSQRLVILAAEK